VSKCDEMNTHKEIGKKKFDHFLRLGLSLNQKSGEEAIESVLDAYLKLNTHDKVSHAIDLKAILSKFPKAFFAKFAKVIIGEMDRRPISWLEVIKFELEDFGDSNYLLQVASCKLW
jgi:hypothetical protein